MEKNWLIRTTKNKILGPISRRKVVDLLQKRALTNNDEVCSGNGFWFYIREEPFVKEYIFENVTQPFNPIFEGDEAIEIASSLPEVQHHPKADTPKPPVNDDAIHKVSDSTSIVNVYRTIWH